MANDKEQQFRILSCSLRQQRKIWLESPSRHRIEATCFRDTCHRVEWPSCISFVVTSFMLIYWPLGNLKDILDLVFKQILMSDDWKIAFAIVLIWMSLDFTYDQSTLVQVMAWCRQATSHYLNQSWPVSLSPCGVTRLQWVNLNILFECQYSQGQQWALTTDIDEIHFLVFVLWDSFLPEASLGLRVLSLPACVCVSVCPSIMSLSER